jgi:hypothetical protein
MFHERSFFMALEARNCTLHEILARTRPLALARYQRHYEWTVAEMEQLLSDLVERFEEQSKDHTSDKYHFIGSVIFYEPSRGNTQIVDGQQRLTSLSMMLAVARDLMPDAGRKTMIDAYLTIPAGLQPGAYPKQRLILHRGDDEFYAKNIVPIGFAAAIKAVRKQESESHERLRTNTIRASKWLEDELGKDKLPAFVDYVTNACRLILITVGDEDDAFRIFETVNSRGRPLRGEDILRVALIDFATQEDKKRSELLRKWDVVERRLGQEAMPRFIAQWRARCLRGGGSNRALHRDIVESFATSADALAYLENALVADGDIFNEISMKRIKGLGNTPTKQGIDKILRSLALVDFDEWIPIAVTFIERHRGAPDLLLTLLKGLDRLAWLFYLKRDDVKIGQDRRKRFGDILKHLVEEVEFDPRSCRFGLSAAEKAEMRGFIQNRIDPKWVPLKPLLVRLEYALTRGRAPDRLMSFTVEHVLPRTPDSDYWYQRFDNKISVVTDYAERIGNLCLVTYEVNQLMDNKPFPDKKAIALEEEAHKMSRLAADFENEVDWNKNIIERRSAWLLNVFREEFDVHA